MKWNYEQMYTYEQCNVMGLYCELYREEFIEYVLSTTEEVIKKQYECKSITDHDSSFHKSFNELEYDCHASFEVSTIKKISSFSDTQVIHELKSNVISLCRQHLYPDEVDDEFVEIFSNIKGKYLVNRILQARRIKSVNECVRWAFDSNDTHYSNFTWNVYRFFTQVERVKTLRKIKNQNPLDDGRQGWQEIMRAENKEEKKRREEVLNSIDYGLTTEDYTFLLDMGDKVFEEQYMNDLFTDVFKMIQYSNKVDSRDIFKKRSRMTGSGFSKQ